ncbi:MAG TPA: glycosyltransferase family 39 protein [Casimicrobiaceae bacterium]
MPFSILAAQIERHAGLIVVAVQVAILALSRASGDFPVNDDWAYAHSVRWLLDEHRIRLSDWIAMNLLPQTLLGAGTSAIFGYSFSTLRHVAQVASVVVALALFHWFIAAGLGRRDALVASLVVMAMPCWPVLSNSFMTDIFGMLFAVPAATLFLRALRAPSAGTLAAATLFAAAGVLQRQVVLVVPAAFLVAWLAANRPWQTRTLAIGVAPFVVALGVELAYYAYLVSGPGVPEAQQYVQGRVLPALFKTFVNEDRYAVWVASNVATLAGYVGLFIAPWALWYGALSRGRERWALLAVAGLAAFMLITGWLPPFRDRNLLDAGGIGPFLLYDSWPRAPATIDRSAGLLWRCAAVAAAYGMIVLVVAAARSAQAIVRSVADDRGERLYLLALLGAYLVPFALTDYIDRYLLFVLPFALVLVTRCWTGPTGMVRVAAAMWIGLALVLGVAATHDYFAWNRARWDAIHAAERLGATPNTLDGGYEYNAYHRFEIKPRITGSGKSWWWIADDRYVVAFSVPPGFVELARFDVDRWLARTPPAIYLLERAGR